MPLTAQGSALVAGSNAGGGPATVAVRVLRAFCIRGERQDVGTVLPEVPRLFARELISVGKAELYIEVAASAPAEPAPPAPAKGKRNAGK